MAIPSVGSLLLNPYPALLPIPEASNREPSALNLRPPVPTGVEPGGMTTQAFNQGGGLGGATGTTQGYVGPDLGPHFPTYQVPAVSQQAQTAVVVPLERSVAPQIPRAATVEVTGGVTPQTDSTGRVNTATTPTTTTTLDALPGLLQVAYRAPLASVLFPLAGLRGEPVSRGSDVFQVEAARAIAPMGEQASHQAFNPNAPTRQTFTAEALKGYGSVPAPREGQGSLAVSRHSLNVVA